MFNQLDDPKRDQSRLFIEPQCRLNANHNLSACRLPPELLEPIVALASRLDVYERSILVVPYSHVCQSWRYIVISAPRLWRYLDVHLPSFMAECLHRSRNVPIHVNKNRVLDAVPSAWVDMWTLHSHRITEISMTISPNSSCDLRLFHSVPVALPCLTVLALCNSSEDDTQIIIPFRSLPALRSLRLHGIYLQDDMWDHISGLICLAFFNRDYHDAAPSFQQVFGIITRSPMLRLIHLGGNLCLSGDLHSMPVLYLSYLQEVYITRQGAPTTFHLLSKLHLPASCKLTLDHPIIHSLTSILPPMATRNVVISDQSRLGISDCSLDVYELTDSNEERTVFSFSGTPITSRFLSNVSQFFQLSKLTFLRARSDIMIPQVTWSSLFVDLPSLTNLEITPSSLKEIILILSAFDNVSVAGISALACPQLHWLSIGILDVDVVLWRDWQNIREVIVPWLHQRANLGAAVHELRLVNFEIRPKFLTTLQDLVNVIILEDLVVGENREGSEEVSDGEGSEGRGKCSEEDDNIVAGDDSSEENAADENCQNF